MHLVERSRTVAQKRHKPDPVLWDQLKPVVKQLREGQTQAEALLWEHLRGHRLLGYKFRRQHAIDRFVVDFYCHQANLIIEVDGLIHQTQIDEDVERQRILEAMGFRVLRFTNDQVLHETEQVQAEILEHLQRTTPTRP